ncbi:kelch-like protein 2 [Metopolophium dirhodum]|uniref:kelch-like protein 2 n=1 Tax=Metopolophium dirhodum TaxID=44670 RepID=UPI00298FAF9F|nr:kelch-like protein 2 [Metopolophium dirhodum]
MGEKAMQHLPCEGKKFKSITFQNSSLSVEVFRALQSLRKDELLCDIKMETDDGRIIYGHKVVLASACPYFLAMFTNFNEKDKAANFLSMDYIKDKCTKFLETQLAPSNCIKTKRFADLHDCTKLKACSEAYIKTQFLEVVKYDDFLYLSPEELIEIITSNDLNAPLEQNVFETVINWVQHESDSRKQYFKNILAHVRLPLIPTEYLLNNVVGHSLIEISPECKNYVNYALNFNFIKTLQKITIPNKICCTRRSGNLNKIILMLSWADEETYINWYDPATNKWNVTSKFCQNRGTGSIMLIKHQFIVLVQPYCRTSEIIDLFSLKPRWIPMPLMKVNRRDFGVGLINHCVYIVGGIDSCSSSIVNSVVVFDINVQEWRRVASMSSKRGCPGIGVLNNLLYAVGGYDFSSGNMYLKSVECYDTTIGIWKLVAEMSEGRSDVSIGVLDGIIYAIGGYNELGYCKAVETYRPSDGFWTRIADLHMERIRPEVVTLHGLMYVMAGRPFKPHNDSVEIYNPKTNTWKLMESCVKGRSAFNSAVVIDRPPHF